MKYYLIAGEASGDLHAANLMRALCACDPGCEFRFQGGDAMAAVGGTPVRHYRDTAVMGIVEAASKLGALARNLAFFRRDLLSWKPDALILVDYPGFNLKIARFAKAHGLRVFWYIAPKVWAHKEYRVRRLRRDVDALYCIFPFEPDWFRAQGLEARYFGNPLCDSIAAWPFRPLEEESPAPRIALLPGSRQHELKFLMPRFAALERMLAADPRFAEYRLTVAAAPSVAAEEYRRFLPAGSKIEVVEGRTYDVLAASRAAVICSGTASLEAALIGTPHVVCYGVHPLTWAIVRRTVKVPYVSPANLSLGRAVFPELLQDAATPEGFFRELEKILPEGPARENQLSGHQSLKTLFGGPGASERIAKDIYGQLARV